MLTWKVDPEDVEFEILEDAAARRLAVVSAIRETVQMHGPRIFQEEVDRTQPLPVDRGEYRRHTEAVDLPGGAALLNTSPHGPIVEWGRKPGSRFPPMDVIERWVRRKFRLRLKDYSGRRKTVNERTWYGGRRKRRLTSARDRAIKGITFVIARKIARDGIPGKHVMLRTEHRLTPLVNEAVGRAEPGLRVR